MLERYEPASYVKLSLEEQKARGILGRLRGVIADFKNPTRNGRKYNEELWENVFKDPIVQEKIEKRVFFGELGHPLDGRTEVLPEKVAICLAEMPKKGSDGKVYGVFDILDTPNGKILKTFCDYGSQIGISSRGTGDIVENYYGEGDSVDPNSYECECWDAVLVPAVREARLEYVKESLDKKRYNKSLRESLQKNIDNASEEDRKIMEETLSEMGINLDKSVEDEPSGSFLLIPVDSYKLVDELGYSDAVQYGEGANAGKVFADDETLKQLSDTLAKEYDLNYDLVFKEGAEPSESEEEVTYICDNCGKEVSSESELYGREQGIIPSAMLNGDEWCADCAGKYGIEEGKKSQAVENTEAMVEELSKALKAQGEAETKLMEAQEKLSVSYAKEAKLNEQIILLKKSNSRLAEQAKRAEALKVRVEKLNENVIKSQEALKEKDISITKLEESVEQLRKRAVALRESYSTSSNSVKTLNEQVETLSTQNKSLQEQLENSKQNFELKKSEYAKKMERANRAVESYKKKAEEATNKYIESQALSLDLSVNDIKSRLTESSTFEDIDRICEDLQDYRVNISNLPFSTLQEDVKMRVVTPKKADTTKPAFSYLDDDIDDQLRALAGL